MHRGVVALLLCLAMCGAARAGAWTQERHHWQIITSFESMHADAEFGATGERDPSAKFDKLYLKSLIEYGWSDSVTLFAAPEFVIAKSTRDGVVKPMRDSAIEIGVRNRLWRGFGVASLQTSYKSAGPSDLSRSMGGDSAQIAEVRLLYGTNLRFLGRDGFADIEVARRWVSRPRPDENLLDMAAGLWLDPRTMLMLQSFNTIGGGAAEPPYTDYRMHKLELSVIRRLSGRWSLQTGAFVSPAGRNSLVEQGVVVSLWLRS